MFLTEEVEHSIPGHWAGQTRSFCAAVTSHRLKVQVGHTRPLQGDLCRPSIATLKYSFQTQPLRKSAGCGKKCVLGFRNHSESLLCPPPLSHHTVGITGQVSPESQGSTQPAPGHSPMSKHGSCRTGTSPKTKQVTGGGEGLGRAQP